MRKCKGKYFENGDYKEFELGYFHQWGIDSEEVEEGVMNFTTAIVELADGKIVTPVASDIKFIDKVVERNVCSHPYWEAEVVFEEEEE